MAGRGSFQAIAPGDVSRLLALPVAEQWDFAGDRRAAILVAEIDKAWVNIHRALSDGTMYGTLGEPPLDMAVLGNHLICQTASDSFIYLKYPSEVGDIARELATVDRTGFVERLAALEPDEDVEFFGLHLVTDDTEYVWPYFEEMQAFYRQAATERLAVLFDWG
jgi:hypothetical protein